MLIRFSVENFLSFLGKETLDLTAVNTCKERSAENTFEKGGETLLKSVVLYGSNASGKSNLIIALQFFCQTVLYSATNSFSSEKIKVIPFLLKSGNKEKPSRLEIEFFLNEKRYCYGFCATEDKFVQEWLYEQGKLVFMRQNSANEDVIQVERIWKKASGLEERTRKNALFLSVCAQFAVPEAEKIIHWFYTKLHVVFAERTSSFKSYSAKQFYSGKYRDEILDFLRNADTNITNLVVTEKNEDDNAVIPAEGPRGEMPVKRKIWKVHSLHNIYNESEQVVDQIEWSFEGLESQGTQKAFALAGPVIDTLKTGAILVVDELDAQLHPIFTRQIVRMFNSSKINPLNAQLIFNTHDTNLLSYKIYDDKCEKEENMFRRDQIYFAEKDRVEATHLYSLIEFKKRGTKKVRNDASFEKDYLNGDYGAIPFIGDLITRGDK